MYLIFKTKTTSVTVKVDWAPLLTLITVTTMVPLV